MSLCGDVGKKRAVGKPASLNGFPLRAHDDTDDDETRSFFDTNAKCTIQSAKVKINDNAELIE